MYKIGLIILALSGLHALPISRHPAKTHHTHALPPGVQDGRPVPLPDSFEVNHKTGLVQDDINEMDRSAEMEDALVQKTGGGWVRVNMQDTIPDGFRQGTEPSNRIPDGFRQGTEPFLPIRDGFKQGTEPSHRLPDGFRQGTEPFLPIRDGFKQGTEPANPTAYRKIALLKALPVQDGDTVPDGFRQGTELCHLIPEGFSQGTELYHRLPDGFRQGTEPFLPIRDGFRQGTEPSIRIPDGFRQGTEPFLPIRDGFRQGTEPGNPSKQRNEALLNAPPAENDNTIPDSFRKGPELYRRLPDGFRQGTEPFMPIRDGFRQGTEPSIRIPDGFRQGTEPFLPIRDGFRQGTEPTDPSEYRKNALLKVPDSFRKGPELYRRLPDGFRQGTEPFMPIRDGFRQGTEPSIRIPDGFRQGTEPFLPIRDGFRQGTEPGNPSKHRNEALLNAPPAENDNTIPDSFRKGNELTNLIENREQSINVLPVKQDQTIQDNFKTSNEILSGFRPGNGPFMPVRDGETQRIEPSNYISASVWQENKLAEMKKPKTPQCGGEIINGRCYTFNPTRLSFLEAQHSCKTLSPDAELASVTSEDLHSRLVSLVTSGGKKEPVMTWLGGTVKNQRGFWLDGAEWGYSDWMPGQPNIHTDKPVCVEMYRLDETWWSAADCDLKRASLCSYPAA